MSEKTDELMRLISPKGLSSNDAKKKGICSWCAEKVNIFSLRDEISIKEYNISGFCQSCQDKTFQEDES